MREEDRTTPSWRTQTPPNPGSLVTSNVFQPVGRIIVACVFATDSRFCWFETTRNFPVSELPITTSNGPVLAPFKGDFAGVFTGADGFTSDVVAVLLVGPIHGFKASRACTLRTRFVRKRRLRAGNFFRA